METSDIYPVFTGDKCPLCGSDVIEHRPIYNYNGTIYHTITCIEEKCEYRKTWFEYPDTEESEA